MKRIISLTLLICVCLVFGGCAEKQVKTKPQVAQMRSICELATMECYYHNVAKYEKKDATGALWWEKDRKFWIEYSGIVTVGIDATKLRINIDGEIVRIELPPAKVLGCKVDQETLNKDSFLVAKDSAKITAKHEDQAYEEAEAKMLEAASNDTALLANAQQRAQKLLEDYVNNIGELVGKEYTIQWVYIEDGNE